MTGRGRASAAPSIPPRHHERLLRRALELTPDRRDARLALAILLFGQQRHADALPHFTHLLDQDPQNAVFRASLAVCTSRIGKTVEAIELFEGCREAFGQDVSFQLDYAEALKYDGRRDESVAVLRRALENCPGSGGAWWALANIKTEPFTAQDIQTMLRHVAAPSSSGPERAHLHYALGQAFEQNTAYETSFAHYARGAVLKRAEMSFDGAAATAAAERAKQIFTAARLAKKQGCPDPAPIFILGMPRAGSTLVEQILASHSKVEGTMELPEIAAIVRDLEAEDPDCFYPQRLAAQNDGMLAALGQRYIDNTQIYRKTEKPYYTDKMPSNCAHVSLIHMILPNAKIVDVRRDPVANGFAVFKQLFGQGVGYSYDFREIAQYYTLYTDRMSHFDEMFPGRVCRIQYEDLVNDIEAQVRRLLAYCGLTFEPACLRFWENRRAIATPSAEQVRRPIFRDGLDAWRHYEPWLGPLKESLAGRPNHSSL